MASHTSCNVPPLIQASATGAVALIRGLPANWRRIGVLSAVDLGKWCHKWWHLVRQVKTGVDSDTLTAWYDYRYGNHTLSDGELRDLSGTAVRGGNDVPFPAYGTQAENAHLAGIHSRKQLTA